MKSSVMSRDNAPGDGKTESGPLIALGRIERIEYPGKFLLRYTTPAIPDRNFKILLLSQIIHQWPALPSTGQPGTSFDYTGSLGIELVNRGTAIRAVFALNGLFQTTDRAPELDEPSPP
jgi:hypothetical protein